MQESWRRGLNFEVQDMHEKSTRIGVNKLNIELCGMKEAVISVMSMSTKHWSYIGYDEVEVENVAKMIQFRKVGSGVQNEEK